MNTTQVYIPDESLSPHLYIGVNRLSTPAVSITVPTAPFHEGQAGPYHPWRQFLFRPNFFSNLHERSSGSRFRAIPPCTNTIGISQLFPCRRWCFIV